MEKSFKIRTVDEWENFCYSTSHAKHVTSQLISRLNPNSNPNHKTGTKFVVRYPIHNVWPAKYRNTRLFAGCMLGLGVLDSGPTLTLAW